MTSLKCKQCGLVNPFNAQECKRCGSTLIDEVNPNAQQGTNQKAGEKKHEQPGIRMARTLVPAVCSICGSNDDVKVQSVERTHIPNWVWLFLPFGFFPARIIGFAVQVKHSLSLPICSKCTQRRSWASAVSFLSLLICTVLIFAAIGVGLALKSWFAFLGICGLIVAIAYLAGKYEESVSPRYTQFTKKRVEIDVPGWGRVLVLDQANEPAGKRR
jgi:ribosomal protein L40E